MACPMNCGLELATGLYRITQELLEQHHEARESRSGGCAVVPSKLLRQFMVQDDGVGFERTGPAQGIGLPGMSDRTRALGGNFVLETSTGKGTLATVRVPLVMPTT